MLLRAIRPCIDPSKYEKYLLQFQERNASRMKQEVGEPGVVDGKYDATSHSRQVGSKSGREEGHCSATSSPKSKRAHVTTATSPSAKETVVQSKTNAGGNDSLLLARILTVATRAARAGGRIMADHLGVELSLTTKVNKSDLVTNIDKQCQKVIEEMIIANFGSIEHGILGEESVAAGREAAALAIDEFVDKYDWLWIVDPIDGTTNFINGIPLSVVSIGVAYRGEVKVACIYDPYRDEIFTAVKGQGAFLNGRKSSVSSVSIEDAVIGVGVSCSPEAYVPEIRVLSALLPRCRTARNLGSACLHLAWISAGRLDAYYELDLNSWDLSAGFLLIQEAGGHVTDASGGRYQLQTRNILACNSSAALHRDLTGIITSCNAQDINVEKR
jgi:myo-inositol-1(or 4)-monophosphatase